MLRKLYNSIMAYAGHPKAFWVLNIVAFAESSFFPLPPDPLFIAMILRDRSQVVQLAAYCTISSVVGGLLGYYIGYGLYESFGMWIIETYNMQDAFQSMQEQFQKWGFWIIALKGLTPIPYKIVTIASGVANFDITTFIVASIIARSFRFATLGALLWYYGPAVKEKLDTHLTTITITGLLAIASGFVLIKYIF